MRVIMKDKYYFIVKGMESENQMADIASEEIKGLEYVLKESGFTRHFEFTLPGLNITWDAEQKRIMCRSLQDYKPLIEHKKVVRIEVFSKWDDLLDKLAKCLGVKRG